MKIEYIRNLTGSYMIIKEAEYAYENAELLMLLNNKIPGLLNLQVIVSDGKLEYWYEITGTTSMGTMMDLFSLDGKNIKHLIEDIYNMNLQLVDYLLDGENILYLPEMIYYDRGKETYRFCYLPGCKTLRQNSLQTLAEYLLPKIDHKDPDAVAIGYAFYEKTIQEFCSAEELLSCTVLQEKVAAEQEIEPKEVVIQEQTTKDAVFGENPPELDWDWGFEEKPGLLKRFMMKKRKKTADKETEDIETPDYERLLAEMNQIGVVAEPQISETPTVFLNMGKQLEIGRLLYQGDGKEENFVLEEENFLVGKDTKLANGVLHADTVSRIHARIYRKEGHYYIEDLNSTNGTYLNGKELFFRQPVKLETMDRIVFGTEEYVFS